MTGSTLASGKGRVEIGPEELLRIGRVRVVAEPAVGLLYRVSIVDSTEAGGSHLMAHQADILRFQLKLVIRRMGVVASLAANHLDSGVDVRAGEKFLDGIVTLLAEVGPLRSQLFGKIRSVGSVATQALALENRYVDKRLGEVLLLLLVTAKAKRRPRFGQ
jgi:hypothetical protein